MRLSAELRRIARDGAHTAVAPPCLDEANGPMRSTAQHTLVQAQIPLFLYPFLNTTSKTRPFEYLRLTALGVIGALVKQDDSTVRQFLPV